jgi:hypothetical protein
MYVLFSVFVVFSSAIVTYYINISRERLWIRSKKAEEIYRNTEEIDFKFSQCFGQNYNLIQTAVCKDKSENIFVINSTLVDLNVLVGLYFPSMCGHLSVLVGSVSTAFHWLEVAEATDEANIEHALQSLDLAVASAKDAFNQFKTNVLSVGSVGRIGISSNFLPKRRAGAQPHRVVSVAS